MTEAAFPATLPCMAASEPSLIARSRAGDPAAFGALVRRYEDRMYRLVRSVCVSAPAEADDVYQDTFLTAYKKLSTFQGRSELGTWLYRVAANLCFMRLRAKKARPTAPLGPQAPGRDPGPEEAVRKKELAEAVTAALAALPPDQRLVVTLRDVEGLSAAEAARTLKLSVPAVKSRLHRGRLALKARLARFAEPP